MYMPENIPPTAPTTGPPMLPGFFNGTPYGPLETNYQIVQTRDYVEIVTRNADIYRKLYGENNESRKPTAHLKH